MELCQKNVLVLSRNRYLKQALSRCNEDFTPWVLGHPGQVVLTVVRQGIDSYDMQSLLCNFHEPQFVSTRYAPLINKLRVACLHSILL